MFNFKRYIREKSKITTKKIDLQTFFLYKNYPKRDARDAIMQKILKESHRVRFCAQNIYPSIAISIKNKAFIE